MSSAPDGWLSLVFTTLGGGVIGAIIAAYGAQGSTRRKARSQALSALERIVSTRGATLEELQYDRQKFAELEAQCMMAGVPRQVVHWFSSLSKAVTGPLIERTSIIQAFQLIHYSDFMVRLSLWHPFLSKIIIPFHLWRLRRAVNRCSRVDQMAWMRDINSDRDVIDLSYLRYYIDTVERQGSQWSRKSVN